MSLYNQIFGVNPNGAYYLFCVSLHPQQVPRLRDVYLFQNQSEVSLAVFTRLGGGNRESYKDQILQLQAHPLYLRDFDDDFDSTYCTFVFKLPPGFEVKSEEVLKSPSETPMAKFRQMIDDMKSQKETPHTRKAFEVGEEIMEKMKPMLEGGGSGIVEV